MSGEEQFNVIAKEYDVIKVAVQLMAELLWLNIK